MSVASSALRKTPAAFRTSPYVAPGGGAGGEGRSKHRRVDSEQFIEPEENVAVSWLHGRGTWAAYVLLIALMRAALTLLPLDNYTQWTVLHSLHSLLQVFTLHWRAGVPSWREHLQLRRSGRGDVSTFWEALCYDERYDAHRRFLTIVPIVLFLITINSDSYPPSVPHLLVNLSLLGIVLLLKLLQTNTKRSSSKTAE